jgi:hypothetical protein
VDRVGAPEEVKAGVVGAREVPEGLAFAALVVAALEVTVIPLVLCSVGADRELRGSYQSRTKVVLLD